MISWEHWFYLCLKNGDVLVLGRVVWMPGFVAILHELGIEFDLTRICMEARGRYHSALSMVYMASKTLKQIMMVSPFQMDGSPISLEGCHAWDAGVASDSPQMNLDVWFELVNSRLLGKWSSDLRREYFSGIQYSPTLWTAWTVRIRIVM